MPLVNEPGPIPLAEDCDDIPASHNGVQGIYHGFILALFFSHPHFWKFKYRVTYNVNL